MSIIYNNLAQSLRCPGISRCIDAGDSEASLIAHLESTVEQFPHTVFRPFAGRHSWAPTVVHPQDTESGALLNTQENSPESALPHHGDITLVDCSHLGIADARKDFQPVRYTDPRFPQSPSYLLPAPAGYTQGQLQRFAVSRNPPLSIVPTGAVQDSIRLGGFLSSGCHGAGWSYPPVSDMVMAVRIVVGQAAPSSFLDEEKCGGEESNSGGLTFRPVLFLDGDLLSQLDPMVLQAMRENGKGNPPIPMVSSLDHCFSLDPEFQALCEAWFPAAGSLEDSPITTVRLMDLVRVHYGSLGITTEFWIRGEAEFLVQATDELVEQPYAMTLVQSYGEVERNLGATVFGYGQIASPPPQFLELFYAPFTRLMSSCLPAVVAPVPLPEPGLVQIKRAYRIRLESLRQTMGSAQKVQKWVQQAKAQSKSKAKPSYVSRWVQRLAHEFLSRQPGGGKDPSSPQAQLVESVTQGISRSGRASLSTEENVLFCADMGSEAMDLVISLGTVERTKKHRPKWFTRWQNRYKQIATVYLLQALGEAAYGIALSSGKLCSGWIGCARIGCAQLWQEDTPRYTRLQSFNDFSLYEVAVMPNLVDPEIEVPLGCGPEELQVGLRNFQGLWAGTLELIHRYAERGEYPCNIMVHCRFNGSSRSLLSSLYHCTERGRENPGGPPRQQHFATLECLCAYNPWAASGAYLESLGRFMEDLYKLWLGDAWVQFRGAGNSSRPTTETTTTTQPQTKLLSSSPRMPPGACLPRPHFAKSWFQPPDGTCEGGTSQGTTAHGTTPQRTTPQLPCCSALPSYVARQFEGNLRVFQRFRRLVDPQGYFYGGLVKQLEARLNGGQTIG